MSDYPPLTALSVIQAGHVVLNPLLCSGNWLRNWYSSTHPSCDGSQSRQIRSIVEFSSQVFHTTVLYDALFVNAAGTGPYNGLITSAPCASDFSSHVFAAHRHPRLCPIANTAPVPTPPQPLLSSIHPHRHPRSQASPKWAAPSLL